MKIIQDLEQDKSAEPTYSDWATPLIVVPKKAKAIA